jgi:tetratricopeptide (TPR) repeat protein
LPVTPASSPSESTRSEVPTTIVTPKEAIDVRELLARAQLALSEERYTEAANDFELASKGAQNSEERFLALRGLGTTRDLLGDPAEALILYLQADTQGSEGHLSDELQVRIVRLLVYLERYEEGAALAERIGENEHSPLEEIALHAAVALGRIDEGDWDRAERSVSEGRTIVDERGLDRVEVPPLDLAALFFAQGELHRLHAEEIKFDPLPPDFLDRLEARCQLILDAQGAFSQAMRCQDAHWSSMSGVRVGELYKELHTDLMNLPAPPEATSPERRLLFEGAMRLRYSVLLRKAVSMMRATVSLLDRSERQSPWRKKAQEALSEIEETQRAEEAAIDALPYTRVELEAALQALGARAASANGGHK